MNGKVVKNLVEFFGESNSIFGLKLYRVGQSATSPSKISKKIS
jgi:hypothetical protein